MKKIAIVTGANTGLGYETTKELLNNNFTVIMGCRNSTKAEEAIVKLKKKIKKEINVQYIYLDLENRSSIEEFVKEVKINYPSINILINNAGVMVPPHTITKNNLELQLDVNYVGHFYLTYLLLDHIENSENSKIINVSSLAGKSNNLGAKIQYDDINFKKNYNEGPKMLGKVGFRAYAQSKFALTLFTCKLARLLQDNSNIKVLTVHPGVCNTDLSRNIKLPKIILNLASPLVGVSTSSQGITPIMEAVLSRTLNTASFIGPTGKKEWKGKPGIVKYHPNSLNIKEQDKLWEWTENELNIKFLNV